MTVNRGHWLVWNSKRWAYDQTSEIDRLAMKVVRSMYSLLKGLDGRARDELYAHIKRSESQPRLAAMVTLAAKLDGVTVLSKDLDHDPMLLNCLNGSVDLRSGTLRAHTRGDMMTKLAPVEYDPKSECPRWMQFLDEVFQRDSEVIGFVKRMAGYVLTADTREESVFILTGKGQNGKSKFLEALRAVLGDYGADTSFVTFTERRDSNTSDLAGLMGKRLVTASEGEDTQSFNESLLKQLSGGDTVTCRHLYQEYFSYVPTYKIVFCTNEVPRIRSQNYAMKRRIKLVPFRQRFYDPEDSKTPVKDDQLLPKLLAECNGILAWMVEGCLQWRTHSLMTPKVIRAEVDRLFQSQDPLAEFIEDWCTLGADAEVEVGLLWKSYLDWCEATLRKPAFKQTQSFSRSLTQRDGIDSKKGTGGIRLLTGIGLASGENDRDSEPESGESGEESVFSVNLPMKDVQGYFSKNTESSPLLATIERENEFSDTAADTNPLTKNDPFFQWDEDFDSVAEHTPPTDAPPPGPAYVCGACQADVTLEEGSPQVYRYTCAACGHVGVLPRHEYKPWLDRQSTGTAKGGG